MTSSNFANWVVLSKLSPKTFRTKPYATSTRLFFHDPIPTHFYTSSYRLDVRLPLQSLTISQIITLVPPKSSDLHTCANASSSLLPLQGPRLGAPARYWKGYPWCSSLNDDGEGESVARSEVGSVTSEQKNWEIMDVDVAYRFVREVCESSCENFMEGIWIKT